VGPAVKNCVNWLLDSHLLELQKITPRVIDLRLENVKWYHFINFASNVIVLCYSLIIMGKTKGEPLFLLLASGIAPPNGPHQMEPNNMYDLFLFPLKIVYIKKIDQKNV
jgi:hypothetical protein